MSSDRPVPLREALDQLHHGAVCHQVQGTLALVIGIIDVSSFLCQETGDGRANTQLGVPQKTG